VISRSHERPLSLMYVARAYVICIPIALLR